MGFNSGFKGLTPDDEASRFPVKSPPHFRHQRSVVCTGASDEDCPVSDVDTGPTGVPSTCNKKSFLNIFTDLKPP